MSKIKFIIMTTAITRPILHKDSIGTFYEKYYKPNEEYINNNFEIYHIINIDYPDKLKNFFTVEETINNFEEIIPKEVNKIYIKTDKPAFLQAFKNIMNKIDELQLLSENNLYWWFEDDWIGTINIDFFKIINITTKFYNSALTMTRNSQIGSFRGGPIMNGFYFLNYFNIEKLGVMNNTCDPEKQVARYYAAKGEIIHSRKLKIKRELKYDYEKKISLILIYFNEQIKNIVADFGLGYYESKFNENIIFDCHFAQITNYDYNNINYLEYKDNSINYKDENNYKLITLDYLINKFNSKSLVYFICKPFCFEDCGRDFANKFNLIKGWSKIGDPTTYS